MRRAARGEPDTGRNDVARQALGARDPQHEAGSGGAQVDLLDEAGQFADAEPRQDGRGHARGAPGAGGEACGDKGERDEKRAGAGVAACEKAEKDGDGERAGTQRQRRFVIGGEIEQDAGPGRRRAPEKRPAEVDFLGIGVL